MVRDIVIILIILIGGYFYIRRFYRFALLAIVFLFALFGQITQKLSQTANYQLEEGGAQKQDEEKIAFSKTQPISAVSFVTL